MSFSRFFSTPPTSKRLLGGLALVVLALLLAACSTTPTPSAAKAPKALAQPTSTTTGNVPGPRSGGCCSSFTYTTTAADTGGSRVELNTGATNGYPERLLIVTPVLTVHGVLTQAYDAHPVGVWYDTATQRWAIVNEDRVFRTLSVSLCFHEIY
jgi:hypothetical protein